MPIRISILIVLCFIIYGSGTAQAKKPQLELNCSANFALYDGDPLGGIGTNLRLLLPVGNKKNYLTASVGVDRLLEELDIDAYSYTFFLTSVGYRKSMESFFVEPKAGLGIVAESGESSFCGFVGIEPGIQKRKFSFSMDYRFISADGLVEGEHFHTFALRVGYRFGGRR